MKKKIVIVTIFLLCLILCFVFISLHNPKETPSKEEGGSGVEDIVDEEDEIIVEDEVDMSGLEYDEQAPSEDEGSTKAEDKIEQSADSSDNEKTDETDDTENTEDKEDSESTEKDTIPEEQRYDKDGDGFVDGWY